MWWEKKQERQRARRESRFLQRHENRATQTDVVTATAKVAAKTTQTEVVSRDVGTQTGRKRPKCKSIVETVREQAAKQALTESDEEVKALMQKRFGR